MCSSQSEGIGIKKGLITSHVQDSHLSKLDLLIWGSPTGAGGTAGQMKRPVWEILRTFHRCCNEKIKSPPPIIPSRSESRFCSRRQQVQQHLEQSVKEVTHVSKQEENRSDFDFDRSIHRLISILHCKHYRELLIGSQNRNKRKERRLSSVSPCEEIRSRPHEDFSQSVRDILGKRERVKEEGD